MGSSDVVDVIVEPTLAPVGGGAAKSTRRVCRPAWYMTFPVLKLVPIEGSPASAPRPFGAGLFVKVGGVAASAAVTVALARTTAARIVRLVWRKRLLPCLVGGDPPKLPFRRIPSSPAAPRRNLALRGRAC